MEQVTLLVKNKEYKITIDPSIKKQINSSIKEDFPNLETIEIKDLVVAYMKRCINSSSLKADLEIINKKLNIS